MIETAITTTLGQCAGAAPALERLAAHELPARVAYTLAKLLAAVKAELTIYEQARAKLFTKHGESREATEAERATLGPQVLTVRPDAVEVFTAEYLELERVPVTLACPAFDLASLNGTAIAAKDVALLGPLVTFTED